MFNLKKMTTMKFKLNMIRGLGILVMVIVVNTSFAQQDPMYTQYFFNSQTINPAYAGTWNSLGFLALARHQWVSWNGAPETYTFSVQSPVRHNVALGLNVIADNVGREKKFGVWGDYAYKIRVTEITSLRMGLKAGFTNYSNNFMSYVLLPGINDPLYQSDMENKFVPNFGVGLYLHNPRWYLGLSVPKIMHQEIVSNENPNNFSLQSDIRHYFFEGGVVIDLGESMKFKPTFLTKATAGAPVQVDLTANFLFNEKFWLGTMYRTGDAVGIIAQWVFDNDLRIGYAYDYSISKLRRYHNGTHEVMISYELRTLKERIVSPRYF